MKTDILLKNMSNSIAYWYTKISNTNQCETIFPIEPKQEEMAYKLLRIQNNDADIIISPENRIYQITKDVFFEVKKQSYMFYLKDITQNTSKKKIVNNIQPYGLKDKNIVKIRKYAQKMFKDKESFAVLLFTITSLENEKTKNKTKLQSLCKLLRENVRSIAFLNSNNGQIIRGVDLVEIVDDRTIMMLLSNITKDCAIKKQQILEKIISSNFSNEKIKINLFNSCDYNYYSELQEIVRKKYDCNLKDTD